MFFVAEEGTVSSFQGIREVIVNDGFIPTEGVINGLLRRQEAKLAKNGSPSLEEP